MQTEMPDGQVLTEYFKDMDGLRKRQKQLQQQGGKTLRILRLHAFPTPNPRYPTTHQGKKEIARRLLQMERAAVKTKKRSNTCLALE